MYRSQAVRLYTLKQAATLVSPQVKNPELSGKTTKAILKGMELLPEKRPQSVLTWLQLLGVNQKTSGSHSQVGVNWAKWQTILTVVGVVITIVAGIPAWLVLKPPDSQTVPQGTPTVLPSGK